MQPPPVPSRSDPSLADPKLCVKINSGLIRGIFKPNHGLVADACVPTCAVLRGHSAVRVDCVCASEVDFAINKTLNNCGKSDKLHLNCLPSPPLPIWRRSNPPAWWFAASTCGHAILRCALRARMAAHADTLFSAASPEPSTLLSQHRAFEVEKRKTDGPVGGNLYEERSIPLDGCSSYRDCMACSVLRLKSN